MSTLTLSAVIQKDHHEILRLYRKYRNAGNDLVAQHNLSSRFTLQIARHSILEELVVHPLLIALRDGRKMIEHEMGEHRALNRRLYELSTLEPGSSGYASKLDEIYRFLKEHFKSEEEEDLPFLEESYSASPAVMGAAAEKFLYMQSWTPYNQFATLGGLLSAPEGAKAELESFFNANHRAHAKRTSRRN